MTGNRASIGTRRIQAKIAKPASSSIGRPKAKLRQRRSMADPVARSIIASPIGGAALSKARERLAEIPGLSLDDAEDIMLATGATDPRNASVKGM